MVDQACRDIISSLNSAFALTVFTAIFNSVFSIFAVVGNIIVLIAIWQTPSLQKPSIILLSGLALADAGVGLVVQPVYTSIHALIATNHTDICFLSYHTYLVVACTFLSVCSGLICFAYVQIYLVVRRQKAKINVQLQNSPQNMTEKIKTALQTFILVLAFSLFSAPYLCVMITIQILQPQKIHWLALDCSVSIVLTNSSINPILYCWRNEKMRGAVKKVVRVLWKRLSTGFEAETGQSIFPRRVPQSPLSGGMSRKRHAYFTEGTVVASLSNDISDNGCADCNIPFAQTTNDPCQDKD
ncbi:hypothetical protein P5673_019136, partial [Acropora cervicornis]